jgi:hypothetical protein
MMKIISLVLSICLAACDVTTKVESADPPSEKFDFYDLEPNDTLEEAQFLTTLENGDLYSVFGDLDRGNVDVFSFFVIKPIDVYLSVDANFAFPVAIFFNSNFELIGTYVGDKDGILNIPDLASYPDPVTASAEMDFFYLLVKSLGGPGPYTFEVWSK